MCGIFCFIGNFKRDLKSIHSKLINRGPDNNTTILFDDNVYFAFYRLIINDFSPIANQPFSYCNMNLICNGEIYNHLAIEKIYNLQTISNSDCEVILPLYYKLLNKNLMDSVDKLKTIKETVIELSNILDGEFAFVIYDRLNNLIIAVRDKMGVRPLFYGIADDEFCFSSEIKATPDNHTVEPFKPSHFMILDNTNILCYEQYYNLEKRIIKYQENITQAIYDKIRYSLTNAVKKRVINTEVELGCLLSGGLDSSLVSALATQIIGKPIKTFAIGMEGSADLEYAKIVAGHIKSNHTTILCTKEEFLEAIPEVIKAIESYDTTSVRASVGNYLVSKYIKKNTNIKIVLNGDYSDEICGGYAYMKKANEEQFDSETFRLLKDIYLFDSLRSDRSIASNGIEARTPFSDPEFIECYLSIPTKFRMGKINELSSVANGVIVNDLNPTNIEKFMLRNAFANSGLLPESVLFRVKTAFSDGVSSVESSWHLTVKAYIDKIITDEEFETRYKLYPFNTPQLKETFYYRKIFESYYPNRANVIPYYWLPKFCGDMIDPSARELKI